MTDKRPSPMRRGVRGAEMRRRVVGPSMIVAWGALVAAVVACSSGGAKATVTPPASAEATQAGSTPTAEQSAVLAVVRRQTQLVGSKDWLGLYATYSPAQQAACPYESYVRKVAAARDARPDFDVTKVSFDRMRVRIDGDKANVSYVELYDGQVIGTVGTSNPDVYVRIDGRWYDDVDTHKPC